MSRQRPAPLPEHLIEEFHKAVDQIKATAAERQNRWRTPRYEARWFEEGPIFRHVEKDRKAAGLSGKNGPY